jgi:hypothetical protein
MTFTAPGEALETQAESTTADHRKAGWTRGDSEGLGVIFAPKPLHGSLQCCMVNIGSETSVLEALNQA